MHSTSYVGGEKLILYVVILNLILMYYSYSVDGIKSIININDYYLLLLA